MSRRWVYLLACLLLAGCGEPGRAVVEIGEKACASHGGLNTADRAPMRMWDVEFQCKNGVLLLWKAIK